VESTIPDKVAPGARPLCFYGAAVWSWLQVLAAYVAQHNAFLFNKKLERETAAGISARIG
jgi:hypothetical protein